MHNHANNSNSYKNIKNVYTYVTQHSLNYIANNNMDVLIPIRVNLIVPVFYGSIKITLSIYVGMSCSF